MLDGQFWTLEREHPKTFRGQQGAKDMYILLPQCAGSFDLAIRTRARKTVEAPGYPHLVTSYPSPRTPRAVTPPAPSISGSSAAPLFAFCVPRDCV